MIDCKFADPKLQTEPLPVGSVCPRCNGKNPECALCGGTGKTKVEVPGRVKCWKLTNEAGFVCSVTTSHCRVCDARVPMGVSGSGVSVRDSTVLLPLLKGCLKARLIAGDCPRYQAANPVDVVAAASKFRMLSNASERADLFSRAFWKQTRLTEKNGGHPPEVLAEKLGALATALSTTETLQEIVDAYTAD